MIRKRAALAALAAITASLPARSAVTISTASTQNMTCSGGICAPTATEAILNVTDLESLLAAGSVKVTTTGSGVQADDIDMNTALGWSNASNLSLDAYKSIAIEKSVSVTGSGGVSLITNDGGSDGVLSISRKGSVVFQNIASQLTINGEAYVLVNSVSMLASEIASNPSGLYALADSYDATGDGTYQSSPIQGTFEGTFEGLGNSISNLSIKDAGLEQSLGLFSIVTGTVENLGLVHVDIVGSKKGRDGVGALAGTSGAHLFNVYATGKIRVQGSKGWVGGLAGVADFIDHSYADVTIEAANANSESAGGLTGALGGGGLINQSFSTGSVTVGDTGAAGALVGECPANATANTIADSYATGPVSAGSNASVGGFFGLVAKSNHSTLFQASYSTGAVLAGGGSLVGGFGGKGTGNTAYSYDYWDVTTSGTNQALGKGKTRGGIVGDSTEELQSGLPQGFDPDIWAEDANKNGGLPYLINNPPK